MPYQEVSFVQIKKRKKRRKFSENSSKKKRLAIAEENKREVLLERHYDNIQEQHKNIKIEQNTYNV